MEEKEYLWKQIEKDIELYKFYLELLLKSAIFVFTVTGGIISYFFSNEQKTFMVYSLFIPILMNLGCFLICSFSHKFSVVLQTEHYTLCENAGIKTPYEMSPLPNVIKLLTFLFGIVVLGISALIIVKIFC